MDIFTGTLALAGGDKWILFGLVFEEADFADFGGIIGEVDFLDKLFVLGE